MTVRAERPPGTAGPQGLRAELWGYLRGLPRHLLLNGLQSSPLLPEHLRWRVLRRLGMRTERCQVQPRSIFTGTDVTIGAGSFVNSYCLFDASAAIAIGRRVSVGPRVSFITTTHDIGGPAERAGTERCLPITVGDGAWIGAGVTVLPGVTIGEGAIVAAGAVVARDCAPNALHGGVPATTLRPLAAPGQPA